jgi:diguanylate cyclase (GGDEF)-like protein
VEVEDFLEVEVEEAEEEVGNLTVMTDETSKKRIEELEQKIKSLESDLIHDSLTCLKTRKYFEEEVKVYFSLPNQDGYKGTRRKQPVAFSDLSFIFFDIDDFKKVNDTLGHQAGDTVLKSVAETVKMSVRDGDTAARWGGEEIVVTLIGANEKDALHKAEEIRAHVENTKFGKYPDLKVTISGGVASAYTGLSFDETLGRADKALYEAKRQGKNRVIPYSEISLKSGNL